MKPIILGGTMDIDSFMAVVRREAKVAFSEEYKMRVSNSRRIVEQWVQQNRSVYGTTTGFGILASRCIPEEQAGLLQRNILWSHAVSVGEPMSIEQVRAIMLMVLQSLGKGVSGVRLELLNLYKEFLNRQLTPFVPKHGSVGYLSPEAHIALLAIGEGKAYYQGEIYAGKTALTKAGLTPIELSYKEGLALISGTASAAALATIAVYDLMMAAKSADITAAITFEILKGIDGAFDERAISMRPHPEILRVAGNMRKMLEGSQFVRKSEPGHLQDALSLRCIPQLHGAVRNVLQNARNVVELELNACNDNPLVWYDGTPLSNGNADSALLGLDMDAVCIAATSLAKISERRNARLIDSGMSGYPWFLVKNPGLNSGLMIPQYTQAGLLNEMRILSSSATVDNVPTSGGQEDYVSMGYNACLKACEVAGKLEYVLAIELLSAYQAQQFAAPDLQRGRGTSIALSKVATIVPFIEEDTPLYPHIVALRECIHSGELVAVMEKELGEL